MDWKTAAKDFLENETQFHLGMLPTEQSHPKTRGLAEGLAADLPAGIRMLQSVDEEVADSVSRVFSGDAFHALVDSLRAALEGGRRVCFSGCGATGRLSILLEARWRHFWTREAGRRPETAAACRARENQVCSIMTGGDHALIRSVENFEDYASFGRRQVQEAGLGPGDVLVAVSEGGETSSVIGTVLEVLDRGGTAFFVFNNPARILSKHIERSRRVIESPGVTVLDLSSGPMAVAGSTRMQATTSELLVVGAALELAVPGAGLERAGATSGTVFARRFRDLLLALRSKRTVERLAAWVEFE